MPSVEGVAARRAALQMLDAVLRRGQTLEAAGGAVRNLPAQDHGLAVAIAGEALRRLPDLDGLIDSATRQRLPDDSKARMVLRLALAQKIGLGTPDHALVATALPLVDGGPRRLVHGVLGTLLRGGLRASDAPRLPLDVEDRWLGAWREEVVTDALEWNPERQFDAILLDAPCSATGTFRRHPEVLYRARPKVIAESAELQGKLLDRAAKWLRRGGILVYSVCSLEREEGEDIVGA